MLGVLVLNCDTEKAKLNNLMFGRAWDAGYRPLGARGPKASLTSEKRQNRTSYDLRGRSPTPESAHDGHAHGTHQLNGIGKSPTSLELRSQTLPTSMRSSTQLTTCSDLPSSSVAVVQSPDPDEAPQGPSAQFTICSDPVVRSPDLEEAQQGSSRQLTTHSDPSSARPDPKESRQESSRQLTTHSDPSSARQPLDLSGLAERALAVAVQDTSSIVGHRRRTERIPGQGLQAPCQKPKRAFDPLIAPQVPGSVRCVLSTHSDPLVSPALHCASPSLTRYPFLQESLWRRYHLAPRFDTQRLGGIGRLVGCCLFNRIDPDRTSANDVASRRVPACPRVLVTTGPRSIQGP